LAGGSQKNYVENLDMMAS